MIQVYDAFNDEYDRNGNVVLDPIECTATFSLDGNWSMHMELPITKNMSTLDDISVVAADTPYGKKQRYRIYGYSKNDTTMSLECLPIFFDSRNHILMDVRPTNKNGQEALNTMLSGTGFTGKSNISKIETSYYVQKNIMEAINGSDENSFTNRWGGEIIYQNENITIDDSIGEDRGLRAEFGFNLNGITEDIDWSDVTTRIYPKAYNGHMLPDGESIDSPKINNYPLVFERVIEYSNIKLRDDASESDEENGTIICDTLSDLYAELRKRAQAEYEAGIDLPNITYNVDMIDLSRTRMYRNYKELLKVMLGDVVRIRHKRLNIETKARVIAMTYDCIQKKILTMTLGQYEHNYFNDVSSVANSIRDVIDTENRTVMAERISGIINAFDVQLRAQRGIADKLDVRAILMEDVDPTSPGYGATCYGTAGLEFANKKTASGDWNWQNAFGPQGLIANAIITGILSDKNGKFYLDMDKGTLRMNDAEFTGDIKGGTININNRFKVDSSGNMRVEGNGYFRGNISGSSISGGTVDGAVITSETNSTALKIQGGRIGLNYGTTNVGYIGTNQMNNYENHKGIVFDLETTGSYMCWAYDDGNEEYYDVKWIYVAKAFSIYAANTLNAGCDIDMHNFTLKNVNFEEGGITGTLNFVQIKKMNSDGTVATWANSCKLRFKNGILVEGTWSN